ncbi:hypothetical protein PVL29_013746 [Vitis rotundifolia]|uniref:Uncharacterized protein n=1 Tax=Vitis rotundifolia TaxID=103349 RepID=A0AA39DPQ6_VITRO|nr:hypothetical protein PVL29_013746 [Vitis rotundifolia]
MPTGFSDKSLSTTTCIRRLTAVLMGEFVLYNKSSGNGEIEFVETLACCVFNTEETFVRIVMSNGTCTAVLMGHSYLVKEVTRGPIGSFIASQIDDKIVFIKTMLHLIYSSRNFAFLERRLFGFIMSGQLTETDV